MKTTTIPRFHLSQTFKQVTLWGILFWVVYSANPLEMRVWAFQQPLRLEPALATIETPQGTIISAELADTPEKREQGLMYRTSLGPDRGMLFTFSDLGYWTFWMKNTRIPLDILWLDEDGAIVHIEHNTPICERKDDFCPRYTPLQKAFSVLEIQGGQAKKLQLRRGSKLKITLPH